MKCYEFQFKIIYFQNDVYEVMTQRTKIQREQIYTFEAHSKSASNAQKSVGTFKVTKLICVEYHYICLFSEKC